MPRTARIVVPRQPHYVFQRGNRRQKVFFGDADYALYKSLMADWCAQEGVEIWAYCLLPTCAHLIAVPRREDGLARAVGEAHRRYTVEINRRKGWTGHLWQGRFGSFAMDNPYTLQAARFIERSPVAAKLARRAEDYKWSSAKAHLKAQDDDLAAVAPLSKMAPDWRTFLKPDPADDFADIVESHAGSGWPLGDDRFLARLARRLDRDTKPRPRGRPRKDAA